MRKVFFSKTKRRLSWTLASRRYRKKVRERWKALGCCIQCGLPCKPFLRCFKHRVKQARYNRKAYAKHLEASKSISIFGLDTTTKDLPSNS